MCSISMETICFKSFTTSLYQLVLKATYSHVQCSLQKLVYNEGLLQADLTQSVCYKQSTQNMNNLE